MKGVLQLNPVWMSSGRIHFQQIWSYYHNVSFHSLWPPILEYIDTIFFQSVKPWAWQASKASPRLLFIPLWLISGPLFWGGPDSAVWEHILCSSCVMHICLNPAPPPAQMTSSSTDHHELTVGVNLFIAYNFTALSRKHHSVPLLYNAVKRTDWSVLYLS